MSNEGERKPGESSRPAPGAKPDSKTAGGGATPAFSRRRPDRPFIPFVRFEDVVARCGHVEKFGLLPDNKDRFRQDRRKKAMSRDCAACRQKRQQEEQDAAARKRAEKESKKAQQASQGKAPTQSAGRLPDGSRFEVQYDAASERWSGTLTVPTPGGEPATFTGTGSALFRLLSSLDKQYRASLT